MKKVCKFCGEKMKRIGEDEWYCEDCEARAWIEDDVLVFEGDGGDMPYGCEACGGDYPNCKSSCPMYDD